MYIYIYKLKWSRHRPGVAYRVCRDIALLFHDRITRRGWVVSSTPRLHFTSGKTRYPFYRRLGGTQGRSGRAENLVFTGIRSRNFQPVVSRYTDWATGPTHKHTHTHTHTHEGESNENLKSAITFPNTARLSVSWQQWYWWFEKWPTGGYGDYIEKLCHYLLLCTINYELKSI